MRKKRVTNILIILTLAATMAVYGNGVSETLPTTTTDTTTTATTMSGTIAGFISDEAATATASFDTDLYDAGAYVSGNYSFSGSDEVTLEKGSAVSKQYGEATAVTLTGTTDKNITIDNGGNALIVTLSDVSISGKLTIKGKGTTFLVLDGANTITASTKCINAEGDLVIQGEGSLSVETEKNGITTDGVLAVMGGDTTVTIAENGKEKGTCLKPVNGFIMDSGSLTLNGNNSTQGIESKGIKVEGSEKTGTGLGYVVINGGTITITSYGKAISAGWDIDDDATTEDTSDDPSPDLYVNGGLITITTLSIPRDDTETLDGVSPEGIEAKNNLVINGGKLVLNTTDDAVNAGNKITINGGLVYAYGSHNDGIDAGGEEWEGILEINGGTIIAIGSGGPETGLDCNSDERFTYTGGTVIALGSGGNNVPSAEGTTGYAVQKNGQYRGGESVALADGKGNVLALFTIPEGYSGENLFFASSSLDGSDCQIGTDIEQVTRETTFEGCALGNVTVTGGTWTTLSFTEHLYNDAPSFGHGGGFGPRPEGDGERPDFPFDPANRPARPQK